MKIIKTLSLAGISLGILLILLETIRRHGDWNQWYLLIDDYIGGSILIFTSYKFRKAPCRYIRHITAAWAILVGGLFYSIVGSVLVFQNSAFESTGQNASAVLFVKIVFMVIVIACLALCLSAKIDQ